MLSILEKIYGAVINTRNALYNRGIFKTHDLGVRTISVGNLTTGGTGKTPLVAFIAEISAENGEKVCILTRGYGRKNERERVLVSEGRNVLVDAETGGDEPVELAHRLIGKAVIVADADRVAAAKWAKEHFEITTFILDDGFQHRRAKRDLDVVCIDATNPFGRRHMLPPGNLRESISNLKRASAIVITRSDQVENLDELEDQLKVRNTTTPIFRSSSSISEFVSLEEFHAKAQRTQRDSLEGVFIFCGIGNPESFFRSIENSDIETTGQLALNDHVTYGTSTIKRIQTEAKAANSKVLVTTAKDAVKLKGVEFTLPCFIAVAETVVTDAEEFRKLITS